MTHWPPGPGHPSTVAWPVRAVSRAASASSPAQKSIVSGTLAGKSMKYVLCRTWLPASSRAQAITVTALSVTYPPSHAASRSRSWREHLNPAHISTASSCRAAARPSPAGASGSTMTRCRIVKTSFSAAVPSIPLPIRGS